MRWDEFAALLSGIGPETALGRVVAIRSETDPDILKHYTQEQRRIRDSWMARNKATISKEEILAAAKHDKKSEGATIKIVVPTSYGHSELKVVTHDELATYLD